MDNINIGSLTLLDFIKDECGGVQAVAKKAHISARAIYKWTNKNHLPRTEWTGETNYSKLLSDMSGFDAELIKQQFNPLNQQPEEA